MNQTIITSVFETSRGNYEELLRVFLYSAKKHMPHARVVVVRDIPDRKGRSNAYNAMTQRLDSWVPVVLATKGDIILCDVDLVFRADLFKVFGLYKFDVAYTGRRHPRKPINGGVVFLRDGAQKFIKRWADVNAKFFRHPALHRVWRRQCCGMNQPAFWYLLKHPAKHGCRMLQIPCARYNACEPEWPGMREDVQVIHLKRDLRLAVKGKGQIPKGAARAIAIWRKYEQASRPVVTP
jgi:hypothetical protein